MRVLVLIFYLFSLKTFSQSIPEIVMADWEGLTRDGGVWISEDNTSGYDAWGMKFSWGLAKKSMNAVLYAIKGEQNVGTIWNFKVYYHPLEKEVIIDQWGGDGSFGHGNIKLLSNGRSESVSSFFNIDGSVFRLKHVQKISGDTKYSETFITNGEGNWQKSQSYVWKRIKR